MLKLLLICFILFSCASSKMVETSLFFGQSKPDGTMISEKDWNSFKENYVSRVFKEGSTVISVNGTWLDTVTHKLISEPTYVVLYYYKPSREISRQIDSLRSWYVHLYQQQSVLRVDRKVKADF